ncbi:MAG: hypothetical protein MZV70_47310 [Desulfobacterales bacterium]|nr:hypothetical protein [Desulfobacterales bacterium]
MNKSFGAQARRLNAPHGIAHIIERHAGFVAGKHFRIGRFNAQRHHQTAGIFEHLQQIIIRIAHAHGAVEVHPQRLTRAVFRIAPQSAGRLAVNRSS